MEDEIRWGLATLIAAGVFFIPTFLVNFLFAPAKIDQKHRGKITGLQDEVAKYKANRAIADGLANLYSELGGLLAEKITSTKKFRDWDKRRDQWWASAVVYIRKNISSSEAVLFSRVSISQKGNENVTFQNQYNQVHCDQLMGLRLLSDKLATLMIKYDKTLESVSR